MSGRTRVRVYRAGPFARAGQVVVDVLTWRHLVVQLARAELRRENARLVLGDLWWIADPLLQMVVYTVLVSVVFQRTLPDYPLFVLSALIPWKALATSVTSGATAITGNERIVRQLAFPRSVLPMARMGAQLWRLAVALVVMVALMALLWPERISLHLLWLPVLGIVQFVFLLPFVLVLSAATVVVRDLANLMRHVMRLALYLSPVLYSVDQLVERVPEAIGAAYRLNPVALLIDGYRDVTYYATAPNASAMLLPFGVGLALLPFALAWFAAMERRFGKLL
jgi:ABC-type polysaccharide/polyol phosphate export permease